MRRERIELSIRFEPMVTTSPPSSSGWTLARTLTVRPSRARSFCSSAAHLAAIKDALKAVTAKDVQVDVKIDPGIIGGLVVKLGSRMVDSSLRTKLNAIKHAMKEAG